MHPKRILLLRPLLLAAFIAGGTASAEGTGEETPPAPAEQPTKAEGGAPSPAPETSPSPLPEEKNRSPNPDRVFSGEPVPEVEEHSWFDSGQSYVGRLFFSPVVKLDRFFSDLTELDPERSRSFARLRSAVRFREDGKPEYAFDVVAEAHVPGINGVLDRFRLILAGAADSVVDGIYSTYGSTAPFSFRDTNQSGNAELRFGAYQGLRSSVDLGAGVLVQLPPGAFTRIRYRLAVPVYDRIVNRLSTSGFWRTDTHFGTRIDDALEYPSNPSTMIRLAGSSQVAQLKSRGVEYGAELVISHAYTSTSALALGMDGTGASRVPVAFDRYRVFARFRHDVLRRWISWRWSPRWAGPGRRSGAATRRWPSPSGSSCRSTGPARCTAKSQRAPNRCAPSPPLSTRSAREKSSGKGASKVSRRPVRG